MRIDELKVGALLQINEAGSKYYTAEDPDTIVLILEVNDGWIKALQGEIADIKIYYGELRYFDVVSPSSFI